MSSWCGNEPGHVQHEATCNSRPFLAAGNNVRGTRSSHPDAEILPLRSIGSNGTRLEEEDLRYQLNELYGSSAYEYDIILAFRNLFEVRGVYIPRRAVSTTNTKGHTAPVQSSSPKPLLCSRSSGYCTKTSGI